MPKNERGLDALVDRQLGRLALASHRHPRTTLLTLLIATLLSAALAQRLELDTDLTRLLPHSFESVQHLDRLEQSMAGVGYVAVVGTGASPAELRRFADELAPQLAALPSIRWVDHRRPTEFFRDRALFYLDVEDLELMRARFEARHLWEVQRLSPLYQGIENGGEPPPIDFGDLRAKYERQTNEAREPYYLDEETNRIVVLAKPTGRASDVGVAERVVGEVQAVVDPIDTRRYGPGFHIELSGRYKKRLDQELQIARDLALASALALVLMVAYLALHFRRVSAVLLVLAPLALGIAWTFGFAGAALGRLNLLTGFIGGILLGLGDHGTHLLTRYDSERARGAAPDEAVRRSFGSTGRAMIAAGAAMAAGFVGLAPSEFRAFRELGIIGAVGMVLVVLAYALALPALLALAPGGRARSVVARPIGSLVSRLPRWAPMLFWLAALGAVAAVSPIARSRFDYDFASLEDRSLPAFRLDKQITRLLGRSQTPVVVLARDEAEEQRAAAAIRAEKERRGEASTVQLVASVADLVPRDQRDKQRHIDEIGWYARRFARGGSDASTRADLLELARLAAARPFDRGDLPIELRRHFEVGDGRLVLVFPAVSDSDGAGLRALARELRGVRLPDGQPLFVAGESMVLADVIDLVMRESPRLLALAAALVLVLLWLLLRRLRDALVCFTVAALTLLVSAGTMAAVDVPFNYLNVVMVPLLFGMAVEGAVHLVVRLRENGDLLDAIGETVSAIGGTIITTALGFGTLLVAQHPGLRSLALVALIGLGVNLLLCLIALPSLLLLLTPAGTGWTRALCTVGRAGDSPVAPGTMGALAALPVGVALAALSWPLHAALLIAATALSVLLVRRYLRHCAGAHDPQEVVLDEFVGCLIALAFVPTEAPWIAAAFVLFRLLDVLKPGPIGWLERRWRGAAGIVGDDVAAGLVAGVALSLARRFGIA